MDDYNYFMNGVDITDQLWARFTTQIQFSRTWMLLFYYLFDTAICNAYILSKHYRKSTKYKYIRGTHRAFREALVNELLRQYKIAPKRKYQTEKSLPPRRLDRPETLHKKQTTTYCGKCYFCRFEKFQESQRKQMLEVIKGVGWNRNVRQTQVMCKHCDVFLCRKCFSLFYNFQALK
jgi:hypothetical protein